jgi:phage terminase small subunit
MGRPRKPSALKDLEGNRARRDIPPEIPLHGTPELPDTLDSVAAEHFTFIAAEFGGAGVLKRVDAAALAILADLWSKYWRASEGYDQASDADERHEWLKHVRGFRSDWEKQASKLGIQVIDRSRLLIAKPESRDATEERFFKVTG